MIATNLQSEARQFLTSFVFSFSVAGGSGLGLYPADLAPQPLPERFRTQNLANRNLLSFPFPIEDFGDHNFNSLRTAPTKPEQKRIYLHLLASKTCSHK